VYWSFAIPNREAKMANTKNAATDAISKFKQFHEPQRQGEQKIHFMEERKERLERRRKRSLDSDNSRRGQDPLAGANEEDPHKDEHIPGIQTNKPLYC
jgi:hypothetical protein